MLSVAKFGVTLCDVGSHPTLLLCDSDLPFHVKFEILTGVMRGFPGDVTYDRSETAKITREIARDLAQWHC
jgi:hypothetical protein